MSRPLLGIARFVCARRWGVIHAFLLPQVLVGVPLWLAVSVCGQRAPLLERHGHRAHLVDDTLYAFGGYGRAARDRSTKQMVAWSAGDPAWRPRAATCLKTTGSF